MKEIISLFLGRKSNYTSTHFWNTLDEYYSLSTDFDPNIKPNNNLGDIFLDWEVMYRSTKDGFTPRFISVDTVGGASFQVPDIEEKVVQVDYRKPTSGGIDYWNDYAMTESHPSSFLTLPYSESSVEGTFDYFHQGKEAFRQGLHGMDSMEDKLRKIMEESDSAQGFMVVCDMNDAFAGLSAETIRHIQDEYRKHVLVFGIADSVAKEKGEAGKQVLQLSKLNETLLFGSMCENKTSFVPLYTRTEPIHPLERAKFDQIYHQSAYLSTALESITTSLRLKKRIGLDSLCSRRIMGLAMQMGQGELVSSTLNESLKVSSINKDIGQYTVIRGSVKEYQEWAHKRIDRWFDVPIPSKYPQYFSPFMTANGTISKIEQETAVTRIPVLTTLYEGLELNPLFETKLDDIKLAIQGHKMGEMIAKDFEQGGIDRDDWEEVRNALEECIAY